MKTETQFYKDLVGEKTIEVNGNPMSIAIYNLIISKRDLGIWKEGMKIHRNWKVSDVKKYFGFTGRDRTKLYIQCCELLAEVEQMIKSE